MKLRHVQLDMGENRNLVEMGLNGRGWFVSEFYGEKYLKVSTLAINEI